MRGRGRGERGGGGEERRERGGEKEERERERERERGREGERGRLGGKNKWERRKTVRTYTASLLPSCRRFDPDRFAPNSPHAKRGLEFCPFGLPSRRKCPGYQFSYFEVSTIVPLLLHRFSLSMDGSQCVERKYGLVTEPKEEFFLTVEKRAV